MQQTTFLGKLTARPSLFLALAALLVMAIAAPAASAHHKPDHAGGPPWQQELRDSLTVEFDDLAATISEDDPLGLAEVVGSDASGTLNGAFEITEPFQIREFEDEDGNVVERLVTSGYLTGTFTPDGGEPIDLGTHYVPDVPVGGVFNPDRCQILFLELGPVFLDVLGLVVEIPDPIVLDIYAERGPGKLLGNLLCAIVGILDPVVEDPVGTPLDRLIDNVNRLLERILG
jgi:hypothetical protein